MNKKLELELPVCSICGLPQIAEWVVKDVYWSKDDCGVVQYVAFVGMSASVICSSGHNSVISLKVVE